jgi:hypothetical protein
LRTRIFWQRVVGVDLLGEIAHQRGLLHLPGEERTFRSEKDPGSGESGGDESERHVAMPLAMIG